MDRIGPPLRSASWRSCGRFVRPRYGAGMTSKTSLAIDGGVAVLRLDDGKANAVGYDTLEAIDAALETAEQDAGALVISGREGRFSAGFDLSVIGEGPEAAQALVAAGARTAARIYGAQVPVVAACTGHALAFGAIMLLSSDVRIGADVEAKIGLTEVSIGMPLPIFAIELARDRLSPRHFTAATSLATVFSPRGAVEAGYLDEVVAAEDLHEAALNRAGALAGHVRRTAFGLTRRTTRQETIDRILSTLDEDIKSFGVLD
ncbi:MAG: crotonase/enoyl-CoA hydratase family protein [Acidimicrobiaceae bacterium]|nr:crotonase/enoyl-CoA hydratase family protein [Acidimicrobiaceae bacterium]